MDSFSAPWVTALTAANLPKVNVAGRPFVQIDSSNGGVPFFTHYSTEQGLPIPTVTCSMEDNIGNIWFGTGGAGVTRYDGKSFKTFTTANGLADNGIQCMMQDRDGNIWIGTGGSGASRYNGKSFTTFSTAQGLVGNRVRSIMQDKDGNIWFGTDGLAGASRYNGKTFTTYTTVHGLPVNNVRSIMQDKNGDMWFGCLDGGASRYDGKSFISYTTDQGLAGNSVRSIIQDKAGDIWFACYGNGISRYNGKTFINYTSEKGLAGNKVRNIMQDNTGDIWFGMNESGVTRYNGKNFTTYGTAQGLITNNVGHIMQDRQGSIWFCSNGAGVSRYDGKSIASYAEAQGFTAYPVFGILQEKGGNIWFGTDRGATMYNSKKFVTYSTAQGLTGEHVICILQDKAGHMWFGTDGRGASRFDGKNFTNFTTTQGLAGNNVRSIIQDKAGNIWFGINGGASRYDGKSITNYTTEQGMIGKYVNTIMEDIKGDLWFGINGGVSRYDGKRFQNYTTANGLAGNTVYCIMEDSYSNIWFGTDGGGVSMYNGKQFINYTTADGLADNAVFVITEDSKRNIIWFGTNLGLSGLKGPFANEKPGRFEIFNRNTGYPIKDLNTSSLIVDHAGMLWAGCGDAKVIKFDYDALYRDTTPLTLHLESLKVNGETVCWNNIAQQSKVNKTDSLVLMNEIATAFGRTLPQAVLDSMRDRYGEVRFDSITPYYPIPVNLVLPYEDRNVTFDFVAPEPRKSNQVKYQYKLEGYSKNWSSPDNTTTAVFGNIPAGSYTFKLKAVGPNGIWSGTEYNFSVLPPWWKTWWAYSFYLLCFMGGLILAGKFQQRYLIRKEREGSKLRELEMQALRAQMNPHFIFNCLSSINRFVLMNETEAASDYLTKFSRLIRTVLNNSKKPLISLEDELEMLRLYLDMEILRFKDGFTYNIKISDPVEPQNIFIPPLLFQPFAENAVWHGLMHKKDPGELNVRLSVEDTLLCFVLEDNGVGRDVAGAAKSKSAEKNKSLGLQITKERLSLINGYADEKTFFDIVDLYDDSGKAAGTKVILKIKYSETTDG